MNDNETQKKKRNGRRILFAVLCFVLLLFGGFAFYMGFSEREEIYRADPQVKQVIDAAHNEQPAANADAAKPEEISVAAPGADVPALQPGEPYVPEESGANGENPEANPQTAREDPVAAAHKSNGSVVEIPETLPDNPIDFDALHEINDSIIGWVYLPEAEVDYPILRSSENGEKYYYLHRNIFREYEYQGSVFIDPANQTDFSDPDSIVYGHNMLNTSMFSLLTRFTDREFFDSVEFFYIYTPGHILKYQIVSAHQFNKQHLFNVYDMHDPESFRQFLEMIQNPRTAVAHVRDGIVLGNSDKIVTLSTCMNHGSARLLIQGVLIDDRITN